MDPRITRAGGFFFGVRDPPAWWVVCLCSALPCALPVGMGTVPIHPSIHPFITRRRCPVRPLSLLLPPPGTHPQTSAHRCNPHRRTISPPSTYLPSKALRPLASLLGPVTGPGSPTAATGPWWTRLNRVQVSQSFRVFKGSFRLQSDSDPDNRNTQQR